MKKIDVHIDRLELSLMFKRSQLRNLLYTPASPVDTRFIEDMSKALDCTGPRFNFNFHKSPTATNEEIWFKHHCRRYSSEGSTLDIYFGPEPYHYFDTKAEELKEGEYVLKAKVRITKTKLPDLVKLASFFHRCHSKGATSVKHIVRTVEFAIDFYPDLSEEVSASEHHKKFTDLLHLINSKFLISRPKDAFYSLAEGHRSPLSLGRYMPEFATFYQNTREDNVRQSRVYWGNNPYVRLELAFFRNWLGYQGIRTISDLFAYDLTRLVMPGGRRKPEIRFLVPNLELFRKNFWNKLEKFSFGRAVKDARINVGNLFLGEMVVKALESAKKRKTGKTGKPALPSNFWRDYFAKDEELTDMVLTSLRLANEGFDRCLAEIEGES